MWKSPTEKCWKEAGAILHNLLAPGNRGSKNSYNRLLSNMASPSETPAKFAELTQSFTTDLPGRHSLMCGAGGPSGVESQWTISLLLLHGSVMWGSVLLATGESHAANELDSSETTMFSVGLPLVQFSLSIVNISNSELFLLLTLEVPHIPDNI